LQFYLKKKYLSFYKYKKSHSIKNGFLKLFRE
jgi:hypothetical protein